MRRQVLVAAAAALAACEQPLKVAGPGQPQVTQVVVAPNPVTLQLSQGQQFRAFGRTQLGDSVGISASWSATGGIISAAGLYTAGQTSGTYQVTAAQSGGSLAASASVTVLAVPVAAVTVSPTTASVLSGQTVQLTATPRDANGTPLSGRVVTWTSVNPAIATVSAAGLVTGVAAGPATITATSEGKSGTAAVTVSNVPVASVVVSPTAANVSVGGTVQLSATPTDAAGAVLTGRVVTWTSVNPAIATVSAAGLVTGVAAGSATITATSEGKSGTAAVNVASPPPPGAAWPNEPSGMTVRTDWGLDQALPTSGDVLIPGSPGWRVVTNSPPGSSSGWTVLASDPSAPFSPVNVYDFVYPQGMVEGTAPATVYYNNVPGTREAYVGFWWKPSSPFDFGPNGNKIAFLFNGGGGAGGQQFLILLPDGRLHVLPEYPGDFRWRDPNVNATVVTLGVWHRVEWYCNLATGMLMWWLDGVLQGSYSNVANTFAFDMFQFSPTWGGNSGAQKRETDHYWFDHVHLSVR
jgi:hypothetical protein